MQRFEISGPLNTMTGFQFEHHGPTTVLHTTLIKQPYPVGEYIFIACYWCENKDADRQLVFKIMADGRVEYGPAFTAEEAAKKGAEILAYHLKEAMNK